MWKDKSENTKLILLSVSHGDLSLQSGQTMILEQKQFCPLRRKKTTPKPRMFQFDSFMSLGLQY